MRAALLGSGLAFFLAPQVVPQRGLPTAAGSPALSVAYGARSAAPRLQVGEGEERPVLGAAAFPALALGLAAALLRRPAGGAPT